MIKFQSGDKYFFINVGNSSFCGTSLDKNKTLSFLEKLFPSKKPIYMSVDAGKININQF